MSYQIQYNDFPTFLRKYFPYKVQKISLNAGFTCPNRDGTKGWGGCTYCNNQTFNPDYCRTEKKDGADVHIAITRLLIRITAGQRSLSLPNWKKGNAFLPINIRK